MGTRAQVRFAIREEGVSFSEHPDKIQAQFYVHHDGYPEGLGVEIAESILYQEKIGAWEIEHVQDKHGDLDYIYYVWSDYDKETWISIFETQYSISYDDDKCIFVGKPDRLIAKYKQNTNEAG
jgi:hypothetical protein|tara:strand:+ start:294 stop:662 length:369 start_codon:yes stop_codon:yes gene_type:complete